MQKDPIPFHRRIILWIVLPVILVGVSISGLLITFLSHPMESFLTRQFNANLRLASNMGLEACEAGLNYLLDLRLEDNLEMNQALKNEALQEVKDISRKMVGIGMLVVEAGHKIKVSTAACSPDQIDLAHTELANNRMLQFTISDRQVRAHVLYFPFWDWHIISYVYEQDFNTPIRTAHRIVYLSTLGVFVIVVITLLLVFHEFLNKPLHRLITATERVSGGELNKVDISSNNELGRLIGAFNSMIDSLEKEKAEVRNLIHQLQISESLFRTLFEHAPVGICVASKQGEILQANSGLLTLTGYSRNRFNALNLFDLFSGAVERTSIIERLQQQHTIENIETEMVCRDGRHNPVRMILTLITIEQQEALFAIIEDITERKKFETHVQQTGRLEAIGSLAGGVAHDFNNLLSPILGFGEILLMDLASDETNRKSVEAIVKAGYKARDIVQQLLAFSRKQTLEVKTVDLNKILADFYNLLHRTIREDIVIKTDLTAPTPLIRADTGQIEQVIMNLCVNAQDAMPKGGEITIRTFLSELDETYTARYQSLKPGNYVMLTVSDTGHGMDAATLARIFDPFFTTKEKGRGTGFGLATVYGIVKQHNGFIWAYSEPGQGAIFKLYFPLVEQDQPAKTAIAQEPENTSGSETILVVEDDENVLDMAIGILRRNGYSVLSTPSAVQALNIVTSMSHPLHLLLTDVIMPEMNGKELFTRIQKLFPELKVIYMSGYMDNVIAHHGILDEEINFIQKPFSIKNLMGKIRSVLDESIPEWK